MRANKQYNYSKPLLKKNKKKKPYSKSDSSNINNKMKGKRVGKKDANTDNTETCYQRGN